MQYARRNDVIFALMTVAIIVVTHAVAYLTHEFSHSFTAWALGYMANPLALDYGDLTPANVVLLSAVGDNVPYDAILSGGHGLAVAVIALAGPFVGNALLYVCLAAFAARVRMRSAMLTSFVFWLMLMCAGNVWSYVPIRAITTHADIAIAASGLRVGVWPLFPVLLMPSLMVVGHFFVRTCPSLIPTIAAHRPARATLVIAVAATWFFTFFGGLGLFANYGEVAQVFSLVSFLILMPVAVIWLFARCSEPMA